MAEWAPDSTKRFSQRPFYTHAEIEERAVAAVKRLTDHTGQALKWPLDDEALELMVEALTDTFDPYADFSKLQMDVDGYTVFARNGRPRVYINRDLAEASRARRRMTIAHELGHVILHQPLYERDDRQLELLIPRDLVPVYCAKKHISVSADWCEWQAAFFAGTLLMPTTMVREVLQKTDTGLTQPSSETSLSARRAAIVLSRAFKVSPEAARVRLAQIGIIIPQGVQALNIQSA